MRFLYPEFLASLALLAIPIIVHLFNFRRYKRIAFTNVKFLRELKEESSGQSKLKKLLVLASRLLAVFMLVMAFAGPYIPLAQNANPGVANEISVYIDNSYSMEARKSDASLLDEAKSKAKELANAFNPNDRFQLLTNDFEGKHQRLVSKDEYLTLIDEVKISPVSRKISEINARQQSVFSTDAASVKSIFVLSDFQKSMVDQAKNTADSLTQTKWIVIPGAENAGNLVIDSVFFISPLHQLKTIEQLIVRVRNFGSEAVENLPLQLSINGQQKSIGNISVAPNDFAFDTISYQLSTSGIQNGSITITDFPITFDDTYYFTYQTQEKKSIAIISEKEANRYLNSVYQSEPFFEVKNFTNGTIDYKKVAESNLVILDGLKVLSSGLTLELQKFVSSGGSLFIFPAQDADLASYQTTLSAINTDYYSTSSILPNEVNFINLQSSLFKSVFEKIPANLDLPKVKNHFVLNKSSGRNSETLLSMKGAEAFLNQYSYKKGKVYVCAVPLNAENSNLPSHAIFVPMMYRAALLSFQEYALAYTIGIDNLLQSSPISLAKNQNLQLLGKNFELVPELRNTDAMSFLFVADQIKEAGSFDLILDKTKLNSFAFNFNRAESVMEFYKPNELSDLGVAKKFSVINSSAKPLDQVLKTSGAGISLWKWAILFVLLFLAIEIFLLRFLK